MKRQVTLLLILMLLPCSLLLSQNVYLYVEIITLERYNSDCWGCGNPDPTWWVSGSHNGSGGGTYTRGWGYSEMPGNSWDLVANGYNGYVINVGYTTATTFTLGIDAWENDCDPSETFETSCNLGINADNNRCTNSSFVTVAFRYDSPCSWHRGWGWCGSYYVEYNYYWSFKSAPTCTPAISPTNNALCSGSTVTFSSGSCNDAYGNNMYRNIKWQRSINTDCSGVSSWSDISGATSTSYTPPQTAGTRLYRVVTTSNCTADFSSCTSTSNCARVTYNPMNGANSGDNPPAIQSAACGTTILPNVATAFSALSPPSAGAAANATYTWSTNPSTGVTISNPNASSTNITFSTPGNYGVSVTYGDACAGADAYSTCNLTVSQPDCNFIYVSWNSGNDLNQGGPGGPVKTLSRAMALVSGSRNYIRMDAGSYTELNVINLVNNVKIEGGYSYSGGNWTKTSAATTSITFSGQESIDANTGHRVGIKANGVSGWTLIDLAITTTTVSTQTSSGRGYSNYGLWLNSCSNYSIVRCNITSGNAAGGAAGANGSNGGNGNAGSTGASDNCNDSDYLNGGAGGAGASVSWGSSGGAGGRGGNAAGESYRSRACSGTAGSGTGAGSVGTGGGTGTLCSDNTADNGSCDGTRDYTAAATSGGDGSSGSPSYIAGSKQTASHVFNSWFLPSGQGASGGNGSGGGGGGGGESSAGERCWSWDNNYGNSGGGGGGGGAGGQGGSGGWGGGGSFAIYRTSSSTGATLTNVVLSPSSGGTGGSGGSGGSGGASGSGGSGNGGCSDNRGTSGGGGNGGAGGGGGRGRDAADGINGALVTDGTTTNPSIGFAPPLTVTISHGTNSVCSNSEITIGRGAAGTWTLPTGATYAMDVNSTTSSYTSSSNTAVIILADGGTLPAALNLITNAATYYNYLVKTTDRTLPTINTSGLPACSGASITLSASGLYGTTVDYDWRIFTTNANTPLQSSSLASPSFTMNTSGTYNIRLRVREQCCGWCKPVYSSFTISDDPSAPSVATLNPAAADVCEGQLLSISGVSGSSGGAGSCNYEYRYRNPSAAWSAWNTTVPGFTSIANGNAEIEMRMNCSGNGCDISPTYNVSWNVVDDPESGAVSRLTPADDVVCPGNLLTPQSSGASGGAGSITDEIQYRIGTSGGWSPYTGPITASATGDYYFQTRRTATGSDCNSSAWSPVGNGQLLWTVTQPLAPTMTLSPNTASVCTGKTVSASMISAGSGGAGCSDSYDYRVDGGGWNPYTPGTSVATLNHTSIDIRATRGSCSGALCSAASNTYSWSIIEPASAGISPGDYLWSGSDGDWSASANWLRYNGSNFNIPTSLPDSGTTVIIRPDATCVYSFPDISISGSVCGNLNLLSGATFSLSNTNELSVYGNWSNSGTFTPNQGTIKFKGNSNSSLSGSTTFRNLKIEKPFEKLLTLGGNIDITGQLDLSSGYILSSASNLLNIEDNATVINASDNSFVKGPVQKTGDDAFVFPTGDFSVSGKVYAPLGIDDPGSDANDAFTAEYFLESSPNNWEPWDMGPGVDHTSGVEYWDIQRKSGSTYPAITLYWYNGTRSGITDLNDLALAHREIINGSLRWVNKGASISGSLSAGSIHSTMPFTCYSPLAFGSTKGSSNPLSVELLYFKGKCDNQQANLSWATMTETNNDHFTVESSPDNLNWDFQGNVNGAGNSNVQQNYSFTDKSPYDPISYYRLSQTDFDGRQTVFNTLAVNCTNASDDDVMVFPNPFTEDITISFPNDWKANTDIWIFDMVGNLIRKSTRCGTINGNEIIDLSGISRGIYYLELITDERIKVVKIVKN